MSAQERVTVTLADDLVRGIDRREKNQSVNHPSTPSSGARQRESPAAASAHEANPAHLSPSEPLASKPFQRRNAVSERPHRRSMCARAHAPCRPVWTCPLSRPSAQCNAAPAASRIKTRIEPPTECYASARRRSPRRSPLSLPSTGSGSKLSHCTGCRQASCSSGC